MHLLKAERLTHRFGGLTALSDFRLSLERGELVGLIGPNGAGKTTVFNLITGVHPPSEGSILFEGKEITGKLPNRITAMGIARTFQNIRLFRDLTVLDNVRTAFYAQVEYGAVEGLFRFGRFSREEERIARRAMVLLDAFGLREWADVQAKNLPYGLQRRLEIARALATGPRLLLLDEPAAGMNPNEILLLMDFIRWIRKEFDLTILLIEHQMPLVMGICERIVVLDFGATIAEGTPKEIQKHPRVLEAYLGDETKP
ncbi:MAG: ABC transporter ATP-binding protein [Deltaproteobacteria bacterium]|nr:ABC transporter ATP-binding protein [Deltaproteobacteria bacterium]